MQLLFNLCGVEGSHASVLDDGAGVNSGEQKRDQEDHASAPLDGSYHDSISARTQIRSLAVRECVKS